MSTENPDREPLAPREHNGDGVHCRRCRKGCCALGTGIGLGIALLCLTVSIAIGFPVIFKNLIATMLPLANGSVTYDAWATPTAATPIFMQFWLFNLTNGAEFLKGSKAALDQIGPFTYQEERRKWNVTNFDNSTISYREFRWFHFRPDMSCCPEDTQLSMVNLAYFTVISQMRYRFGSIIHMLVEDMFVATNNPPIMSHTAKEILWGYLDPTLEFASDLSKILGYKIDPHIGLFYGKNGTHDGQYLIFSGHSDVSLLALIDRWQGNTTLSTWSSKEANMLNGTDGTMFPPFVDTSKLLYIYSTDICRSVYAVYLGPTSVKGIDALHFEAPASMFQNYTLNPANAGFCLDGVCLDTGLLNLSTCQPGVPAVASQPHFYQAAEQYIDGVIGMNPSPEDATFLDVEPNTGLVMRASKKLQINLAVATAPGFHRSSDVVPVFMPLLWVNESATIDDASADQLRSTVLLAIKVANIAQWVSLAVGLVCLIACGLACALPVISRRRQRAAAVCGTDYPEIGGSVQQRDTDGVGHEGPDA